MHARAIADRLPPLYTDGELFESLLAAGPGLALEILDEDLVEVRRAHALDTALERGEAVALAALLDIAPEPWQDLGDFRAWVHALREAVLVHGAVGRRALQVFVESYTARHVPSSAAPALLVARPAAEADWLLEPEAAAVPVAVRTSRASFVENPRAVRTHRTQRPEGVEPLDRATVVNAGLDPVTTGLLLVGAAAGPEHVPVVVNVTTGAAVVFLGTLGQGQRLRITASGPEAGAPARATLEGQDVTSLLRTVSGVTPGVPWDAAQLDAEPVALTLARGPNTLWYLPVAHYGSPGLDRALLALASLDLRQGRFDETAFDAALFHQDAAATLTVGWAETRPATVEIGLPGGALLAHRGTTPEAVADRDDLARALDLGVDRLAGLGVRTAVRVTPFREVQPQDDRLDGWLPRTVRERGPTGADALPDAGGVFQVTTYDDSTYT